MNFALMFALALGIDYALFVVARFRAALFGSKLTPVEAAAVAMDTAGKAVLFSGLTVLISLSAVMLVPSPAFRSMSLGIMLSVLFVLAATLTLLPAVLAQARAEGRTGSRCRWVHSGEHRSPRFAAWAERLWRRPLALRRGRGRDPRRARPAGLLAWTPACRRSRSCPRTTSRGRATTQVQDAFGPGAPGALQIVVPAGKADAVAGTAASDPGIAAVLPASRARRASSR